MTVARDTGRAERLAKQYPALAAVPPQERLPITQAAMKNPAVIGLSLGLLLIVVPILVLILFRILGVGQDTARWITLAKVGVCGIAIGVPMSILYIRCIMPPFIRKEMAKRGYSL